MELKPWSKKTPKKGECKSRRCGETIICSHCLLSAIQKPGSFTAKREHVFPKQSLYAALNGFHFTQRKKKKKIITKKIK